MGTIKNYSCFFDQGMIDRDGELMPGISVGNCKKYNLRYYPVCIECLAGF